MSLSILLALVGLGLLFYFMHRSHGRMCGYTDEHGDHGGRAEDRASATAAGATSPQDAAPIRPSIAGVLVLTLILLLPLMLLHGVVPAGSPFHGLLSWVALLLPLLVIPFLLQRGNHSVEEARQRLEAEREAAWRQERLRVAGPLGDRAAREMVIDATRYEDDLVIFEGRLRGDAESAYRSLATSFAEFGRAPRVLEGERGRVLVVAVPLSREATSLRPQRLVTPLLLLVATLVTTTWAGALHQGVNLLQQPGRFAIGLPYALALMAILGVHELGHYVAGRIHGIDVSLPYFIPVPMGLGTFGAFIQIRGPVPDRRKLFDVGVAGPLAGLVIALPALYFGLKGAVSAPSGPGVSLAGSVLLSWIFGLAGGGSIAPDHVVRLGPVGFAGWLGLLVTALNLIPVGQLDGGHVAYALFGRRRAETFGWVAVFLLVALGLFYWSGWLTWAILIFFLGGVKHEPALNELPAPGWRRQAIGALAFVLLFLIMAPVPHRFMTLLGIACPYV